MEYQDILRNEKHYQLIKAVVFDSPFYSSYQFVRKVMSSNKQFSNVMTKLALVPIRLQIKSNLGYDVLGKNKPQNKTAIIQVPGFFMIGEDDQVSSNDVL